MTEKSFSKAVKNQKHSLSAEETEKRAKAKREYDEAMQILADCGVPFGPDGEPLGIG